MAEKNYVMLTHYNTSQDANLKQHMLVPLSSYKRYCSIICCMWTTIPCANFHPQKQNFLQILCFVFGCWTFICHAEDENHRTWRVFECYCMWIFWISISCICFCMFSCILLVLCRYLCSVSMSDLNTCGRKRTVGYLRIDCIMRS